MGLLKARIFSAFVKSPQSSSAARSNFSFSNSSRTKDFTTRMPLMFSCTDSFRRSYFLNTAWNSGMVSRITRASPPPRRGMVSTKIQAMRPPMMKAIVKEKIIIRGARKASRVSII